MVQDYSLIEPEADAQPIAKQAPWFGDIMTKHEQCSLTKTAISYEKIRHAPSNGHPS